MACKGNRFGMVFYLPTYIIYTHLLNAQSRFPYKDFVLYFFELSEKHRLSHYISWFPRETDMAAHVAAVGPAATYIYVSITFLIFLIVLHPTKEGQFPRDPIFFGKIPIF